MTRRALKVLVTGASGFVGRQVVSALLARGVEVHAASQRRHDWPSPIEGRFGDLLDADFTRRLVEETRPEIVLHLAWFVEHGKFWMARENLDWVIATINLAKAAADAGVRRFVGVGTCYEYRWPADGDCEEDATPIEPATLYAASKDAVRRLLMELRVFSFAWARLFYLYGPFENERRLVASLASALARDQAAPLSRGLAVRDFMDVRDAGAALAALALSDVCGPVNIGGGRGVTIASIAERLGQISGKPHLLRYGALADRPNEPPRIVAAVERLQREVGFQPHRTLDQGLCEAYSWWRGQGGSP